jgi:hypothetical protein
MKLITTLAPLALGLLLSGCAAYTGQISRSASPSPAIVEASPTSEALQTLHTGVTIKVPDNNFTVTLNATQKTAEFGDVTKNLQAGYGSVTIGETAVVVGDAIASTIAVNNGGSGEFFYLAIFENSSKGWTMMATAPLADRIQFQELTATGSTIYVKYLDHAPDQAMVEAPTVEVNQTYKYLNGKLTLQK